MFLFKHLQQNKEQQKLNEAIRLLEMVPETRELLRMVREDHVEIRFGTNLGKAGAAYSPGSSTRPQYIEVIPFYSAADTAASLAHELRHYWQYKKLGLAELDSDRISGNPRLKFIFNRIVEADAYGAAWRFESVLEEKCPGVFDKSGEKRKPAFLKNEEDIFFYNLLLPNLAYYDFKTARQLHYAYIDERATQEHPDNTKQELTMADMRQLLKTGVADTAAAYLDNFSDSRLEEIVLSCVDKEAYLMAPLVEKFKAAVAGHDEQAVAAVRCETQKMIDSFPAL